VAEVLSKAQIEEHYIPLLKRLSGGDWFTSRTSSTSLFAAVYSKLGKDLQDELRKLFSALCNDDTPMVRRAAARDLGVSGIVVTALTVHPAELPFCQQPLAKNLSKELVVSDVIPLYRKLSSDDQDSVRLLTAQDLIAIAEILDDEETKSYLLPSIRSAVSDKSWRVRYMVADHFVEVSKAWR
jgi:serine/threonine-protein phosphatase 2A regulatory subunit A